LGTAPQRSFESSDQTGLPRQFDRYELLARLPGAGMSEVYRARTVIGKIVLIKILPPQEDQPDARVRFLDEARIAASLSHENIVSVYDYGEFAGLPYIVMEFLDGETLESLIGRRGTTGDRRSLEIGLQVARALEFVHEHNIVHRDVKPSNIFVTKSGLVKLIDFGVAKGADATLKTQAGIALGTVFYMAPEQVEGERTPSIDIWAFGLILLEMLTGKRPIDGDSVVNVLYKIRNEPVDLDLLRQSAVGRQAFDLVQHCVAREPSARPQCFTQIAVELEQLLQRSQTRVPERDPDPPLPVPDPHPVPPPWRGTSHIRVVVTVVIAILAFLGVAIVGLKYIQTPPTLVVRNEAGNSIEPPPPPPPPKKINLSSGNLLLVGGGDFFFGGDSKPSSLPAFYIDETEVTERAYREFASQHKLADPHPSAPEDLPVTGITFKQAQDFCAFADKRLPSAEEWEKAARGMDSRVYPWGNQEDPTLANVASGKRSGLRAVGSFPGGHSPYGALDMAGNVWEFVNAPRAPRAEEIRDFRNHYPKFEISDGLWDSIYGGSYKLGIADAKSNDPALVPPKYYSEVTGFRCARDVTRPAQN